MVNTVEQVILAYLYKRLVKYLAKLPEVSVFNGPAEVLVRDLTAHNWPVLSGQVNGDILELYGPYADYHLVLADPEVFKHIDKAAQEVAVYLELRRVVRNDRDPAKLQLDLTTRAKLNAHNAKRTSPSRKSDR